MTRIGLHDINPGSAAAHQGFVVDPATGLLVPADVVLGLTSADSSVTIADNGDGTWDLATTPGGGGSVTQSYVGYDTIGGSTFAFTANRAYLKKVTLTGNGLLTDIEAYLANTADSVDAIMVALYTDSSGTPDKILAYNANPGTTVIPRPAAGTNGAARWLGVPISRYLTAGDYWIAMMFTGAVALTMAYDTTSSDKYYTSGGAWFADGGRYTLTTDTNKCYSMRASVLYV